MSTWFRAKKLSLSLVKTNFVLFGSRRTLISDCNLNLLAFITVAYYCTSVLLEILSCTCLRIYKEHIHSVSKKVWSKIGIIISRISYAIPKYLQVVLCYSLIFQNLSYCNISWASIYQSHITRLVFLQKLAIRIICKCHNGDSRLLNPCS